MPEFCVETVDAHGQGFCAPIDIVHGFNNVLAGLCFVSGRDAVFEVKIDDISSGGRHLLENCRARAWAKQLTAVRTGGASGLDFEAHEAVTLG